MINMYIINSTLDGYVPFLRNASCKNTFMSLAIMYQPVKDGTLQPVQL